MALSATRWAWEQPGLTAPQKLTLLALADRADTKQWHCFPSYADIVSRTGLNRKTVTAAMRHLRIAGLIIDTGRRRGRLKRVKVYRLAGEPNVKPLDEEVPGAQSAASMLPGVNRSENGPIKRSENGPINRPENGTRNLSVESVSAGAPLASRPHGLSEETERQLHQLKEDLRNG